MTTFAEYPCRYLHNHDGDTVTVEIEYRVDALLKRRDLETINVRLVGLNTPEIDGGTVMTRAEAVRAKGNLAAWFVGTASDTLEWPHVFVFDGHLDQAHRWFGDIYPFGHSPGTDGAVAYMLSLGWPPYVKPGGTP